METLGLTDPRPFFAKEEEVSMIETYESPTCCTKIRGYLDGTDLSADTKGYIEKLSEELTEAFISDNAMVHLLSICDSNNQEKTIFHGSDFTLSCIAYAHNNDLLDSKKVQLLDLDTGFIESVAKQYDKYSLDEFRKMITSKNRNGSMEVFYNVERVQKRTNETMIGSEGDKK